MARLHKLAIGSLDRHQPGSLLCRQPSGNSVWQSGLQNAMSMAFCEADCHSRNQNGILSFRMPVCGMDQAKPSFARSRWHSAKPNANNGCLDYRLPQLWQCDQQHATSSDPHGHLGRRMPQLWQRAEPNAMPWHFGARIAIRLACESLSQPRSCLQNTVRQ